MIGKLERLPLREVWKHEAQDFTTWLEENIDILNESLDLSLTVVEREGSAGTFSVDIVAEDESGNPVVIENQLEKSNHDHLGKLITYLTAIEAKMAIWVVADPRPEHVAAVGWLNESSAADFYLVKVEAIKIGNSPPAPLLTLIVGPSEERRETGKTKEGLAERHIFRQKFWTRLLENVRSKTKLHANISPNRFAHISTSAGKPGLYFIYTIRQHGVTAELYIDLRKDAEEETKAIFDKLYESKRSIEKVFGGRLQWERLETKRACRVRKQIDIGGYRDPEEKWSKIHDAMIDAMIRLAKALKPHIAKLRI